MGEIRNKATGKMLQPYDDGKGYLRVKLDGENCRLHILVAVAHVPNPDPERKTVVNHKRGKKTRLQGFTIGVGNAKGKRSSRLENRALQT